MLVTINTAPIIPFNVSVSSRKTDSRNAAVIGLSAHSTPALSEMILAGQFKIDYTKYQKELEFWKDLIAKKEEQQWKSEYFVTF